MAQLFNKSQNYKHHRKRQLSNFITNHQESKTKKYYYSRSIIPITMSSLLYLLSISLLSSVILNNINSCLAQLQQQNYLLQGHNLENFRIPETTPVDSIVYQLKALDRFNENRKFSYHMTGDTFSVNEETGEVKLVKPLDRERQSRYIVILSVFDYNDAKGETLETKKRTIIIDDVDDSKPIFGLNNYSLTANIPQGHFVYQVDVNEQVPNNTVILSDIQVIDSDEGLNAEVIFECRQKHSTNSACDVFSIQSKQFGIGKYFVSIKTKALLDYEKIQSYRFSLNARGKRPSPLKGVPLESEAIININIINVQDEGPIFLNAPYSLSMPEGLKNGTRLLNLIVHDGDAAPQRDLNVIVAPGPFSDYFQITKDINSTNIWYLETNTTIDRENSLISDIGNMFTINLLAGELDDSGSPIASEDEILSAMREINYSKGTLKKESVTIVILDQPDSRPIFVRASSGLPIKDNVLTLNVSESILTGSSVPYLDLAVKDIDQGVNSRFNLSLMDIDVGDDVLNGPPPASSVFALESQIIYGRSEVVLIVLNSSLLDYENSNYRTYKFNLVASKNNSPPLVQILEIQLKITDSNDNSPEFDQDQYVINASESSLPGTLIATIKAIDRDSGLFGKIDYFLRGPGSSKFRLVSNEGKIIVGDCGIIQCLDYETQQSFSLTYEARDGGGRITNVSVIINVIDINDHWPRFTESIYKRELISDNLSSKQNYISPQLIVRAKDDDGPTQGRNNITYKIKSSNLTGLDVDSISGLVYLSEPVDLVNMINTNNNNPRSSSLSSSGQKIVFEAEVVASDNGTPPQNSTSKIILTVKGNRDGAPTFKQDFYQAFVRENHPINKPFYQVQAIDPDDKDSQLRYSLGFDLNDLININSTSGEISFKTKVDYDDFKGLPYNITVYATDNSRPYPLRATVVVSIIVQDVNDKAPKFEQKEYKTTLIQSRTKPGDIVLELNAVDPDKNSLLNYSIIFDQLLVSDRNGEQFTLDELVNSTTGYLFYMNKADRIQMANNLRKLFQINKKTGSIELKHDPDYSFAASITILVKVQDLNQEIFNTIQVIGSTPEIQQDFATCTFYFQAHIDKSPIFAPPWTIERNEYNISMLEELPIGTQIFSLLAKDPTTNNRIEMFEKVFESDPRDLFSVDRSGLVMINKRIDYEELPSNNKRLTLSVKALSNDVYYSTANLHISVIDLNDNAPQFKNLSYSVSISESTSNPKEILTLHADDKDSNQFGQVFYSLTGYSSEYFSIDPRRGILTVKKGVKLDRDTESKHIVQVIASDCNETKPTNNVDTQINEYFQQKSQQDLSACKRSSVFVNITLIDENDNDPIFINVNKRGEYEATIAETTSIGTVVAHAHAIDIDEGENGLVDYEIVHGHDEHISKLFGISGRDGYITVLGSLSGMGRSQPYKITIRAFDQGKTSRQSYAYLLLTVSDVVSNDGIPKFVLPKSSDEVVQLSENAGPNTLVYQIQAIDPDEDTNGKLMYKFMQPSDMFDIDPFEGIIKTQNRHNFHLDRETVPQYTLIVIAQDLGSPPKQAQHVLTINITDVNDNEPYFDRGIDDPPIVLEVEEEIPKDRLIGTIQATDRDIGQNALLGYEIIEGNINNLFRLEFEPENYDSSLLNQSKNYDIIGNNPCKIYSTDRLDRETKEKYTLTIRVSSMSKIRNPHIHHIRDPLSSRNSFNQYNASDLTKIRVTIKLIDINDNRPIFLQKNAKSIVDSSAEIYSQLMVFKAIDADSSNSEIRYSILDVLYYSDYYHNTQNQPISMKYVFDIDSKTGIMRNTVSLRSYIDGYFEVFVKADSGLYNQIHIKEREGDDFLNNNPLSDKKSQDSLLANKCHNTEEGSDKQITNITTPKFAYSDLENCFVSVVKAVVFVTHQRETFRFVFNKTKLNDRLDEFKDKIELALEKLMFEPSQGQVLASTNNNGQLSTGDNYNNHQQQSKAEKIFLNTFNTEFYEREDGSLDFSTLSSCSQLVKFDDRSQEQDGDYNLRSPINSNHNNNNVVSNQVVGYDEVLNLLKTLNSTQNRNQKWSLFSQYGLVNIEKCLQDKTLYKMTLSEKIAIYFAAMIAFVGILLALIVSNMRKNYEKKLKLLQRSKYQYMSQYSTLPPGFVYCK